MRRNDVAGRDVEVVVVGGGLAGLTAALRAATEGASVVLLERSSDLGGRGGSQEREGFVFNRGGHALYAAGPGMRVLRGLAVEPDGVRPPTAGMALSAGSLMPLPVSPAALVRTRLLRLGAKPAFARLFASLPRLDVEALAPVTFRDWVEGTVRDPRARQLLEALGRLSSYANAPHLVSAGAVVAQLQGALAGVLYLNGGWQRLVEALAAQARSAGVDVRTGTEVSEVTAHPFGWQVRGRDGAVSAGSVVLAGLAPTMTARLVGMAPNAFAHAGPAVEAAVLDLSLGSQPASRFVLGIDVPTYFSVHGPPAAMAPAGCAAAVAMKYLPVGEDTELAADRADLDAVAAAAGATDVRDTRFLRRMTVTHGLPLAAQGGLRGRPSVTVDERPGVFVAGDWVGTEGMLADAAFASGDCAGRAAAGAARSAAVAGAAP